MNTDWNYLKFATAEDEKTNERLAHAVEITNAALSEARCAESASAPRSKERREARKIVKSLEEQRQNLIRQYPVQVVDWHEAYKFVLAQIDEYEGEQRTKIARVIERHTLAGTDQVDMLVAFALDEGKLAARLAACVEVREWIKRQERWHGLQRGDTRDHFSAWADRVFTGLLLDVAESVDHYNSEAWQRGVDTVKWALVREIASGMHGAARMVLSDARASE